MTTRRGDFGPARRGLPGTSGADGAGCSTTQASASGDATPYMAVARAARSSRSDCHASTTTHGHHNGQTPRRRQSDGLSCNTKCACRGGYGVDIRPLWCSKSSHTVTTAKMPFGAPTDVRPVMHAVELYLRDSFIAGTSCRKQVVASTNDH